MMDVQPTVQVAGKARRATPWQYRTLVWNFTQRDLKTRFKGTVIGWAWSFVAPLATIAIYSVVFAVFIRIQPPPLADGRAGNYAVWLICGMVPWAFLSMGTMVGMPSLLGNGPLLQKVYIPSFVPVTASVLAAAFQSAIELCLVLVILLAVANVGLTWLLIPVWALALLVFVGSLSYVLAVINVYWRDLAQITGVLLQLLFFLSPVIYPVEMVPEYVGPVPARLVVEANPLAGFITVGRDLMYGLTLPSAKLVLYLAVWVGLAVLASRLVFRRWGQDIGEAV